MTDRMAASYCARLVALLMLEAALSQAHDIEFYVNLRWVVCAAAVLAARAVDGSLRYVFIAVAIAFNPVIPMRGERVVWVWVDLATLTTFGLSIVSDTRTPYVRRLFRRLATEPWRGGVARNVVRVIVCLVGVVYLVLGPVLGALSEIRIAVDSCVGDAVVTETEDELVCSDDDCGYLTHARYTFSVADKAYRGLGDGDLERGERTRVEYACSAPGNNRLYGERPDVIFRLAFALAVVMAGWLLSGFAPRESSVSPAAAGQ